MKKSMTTNEINAIWRAEYPSLMENFQKEVQTPATDLSGQLQKIQRMNVILDRIKEIVNMRPNNLFIEIPVETLPEYPKLDAWPKFEI